MKVLQRVLCAAAALALGCAVNAQEDSSFAGVFNDWHLSLGVSYRDFKSPKFHSAKSGIGEAAYNITDGVSGLDTVENIVAKYSDLRSTTIYKVSNSGGGGSSSGSYGFWECTGIRLGVEYVLFTEGSVNLSAAANVQYYQLDSASRHGNYSGSETTTPYGMVYGSISPYPIGDSVSSNLLGGSAKTKMDMQLVVLDLGASVSYEFENGLALSLAAGPSLTVADIDSSTSAGSSYGGAVHKHDDDLELEFGCYVSGGVSYWFSERMGIGADIRYDEAFGDVGTSYVTQNLDSFSGMLSFLLRF